MSNTLSSIDSNKYGWNKRTRSVNVGGTAGIDLVPQGYGYILGGFLMILRSIYYSQAKWRINYGKIQDT